MSTGRAASSHAEPARPARFSRRVPRVGRARLSVCALVLLAVVGCSSQPQQQGAGTAFVSGNGVVTLVPDERRGEPVALAGSTLDGDQLDVAALRGKPVVLNIWGSWCSPCRKEAPQLQAAYRELREDGVAFVGINTRDTTAGALAFERRFAIEYPSIVDTGGLLLQLRGALGPKSYPTTLVLDAQGRIAARVSGPVTQVTLRDLVRDAGA